MMSLLWMRCLLGLLAAGLAARTTEARADSAHVHGIDPLNSKLSYDHAKNHLAHLRVLAPSTGDQEYRNQDSAQIHYTHNISRDDGSHDLVHYNVSHVVGVVSLDVSQPALR